MQVKYSEEKLSARGLPVSSTKAALIECSTMASNDNSHAVGISKIVTPMIVPRASNNSRNNNRKDA